MWFPSSHSSPCCGCTFPSPHAPTPSGTFSVDWNGWKGWKICPKTITVGAKLCEGPKIYLTSHSEDNTKLNPPSEDGWRNTHPSVLPVWASTLPCLWSRAPSGPSWRRWRCQDVERPFPPRCSQQISTHRHSENKAEESNDPLQPTLGPLVCEETYCWDFLGSPPLCVAAKGGAVCCESRVAVAATWKTRKTPLTLLPREKETCEVERKHAWVPQKHGFILD